MPFPHLSYKLEYPVLKETAEYDSYSIVRSCANWLIKSSLFSLRVFVGSEPLYLLQGTFSHFPQCFTTIIYSAYFFAGIFQPEYLSFDYRTAFTIYRIILTFRTYNTTATDNFIHILTIPLYKREVVYFFIFDFGVGNSLYIAWNKPVKNSLLSTSSTNSISFAPS